MFVFLSSPMAPPLLWYHLRRFVDTFFMLVSFPTGTFYSVNCLSYLRPCSFSTCSNDFVAGIILFAHFKTFLQVLYIFVGLSCSTMQSNALFYDLWFPFWAALEVLRTKTTKYVRFKLRNLTDTACAFLVSPRVSHILMEQRCVDLILHDFTLPFSTIVIFEVHFVVPVCTALVNPHCRSCI